MLGMCTSVRENFSETKFFSIIQVNDVINLAVYGLTKQINMHTNFYRSMNSIHI